MKIVQAETILISVPFESGGLPPWGWGGAPANTFDTLLVRLETADHPVGWGGAFSRMADVALKQVIDTRVLPLVVGRDARQIARIKHDVEFNLHNFGRNGGIMYGISAVDILTSPGDLDAVSRPGVPGDGGQTVLMPTTVPPVAVATTRWLPPARTFSQNSSSCELPRK